MKTILFTRYAPPEKPGFNDRFAILDDAGNQVYSDICSMSPNWMFGQDAPDRTWSAHYGCVADGLVFLGQCLNVTWGAAPFGKCIAFNRVAGVSGPLLSSVPNPTHQGQPYLVDTFWHHSFPNELHADWRGSSGCFTSPADVLAVAMGFFALDEWVLIKTASNQSA